MITCPRCGLLGSNEAQANSPARWVKCVCRRYLAHCDIAANTSGVAEFDLAELTPDGTLTYQELLGSHGTELGEFSTYAEAEACRKAWQDQMPN